MHSVAVYKFSWLWYSSFFVKFQFISSSLYKYYIIPGTATVLIGITLFYEFNSVLNMKFSFEFRSFLLSNTNALKLKTAQYQLAGIYIKEQTEYIQNQIDKIRDSVEDRQSRIAWQTINEVSRRKNTAKAKLKAANQQERIKLWKQHFENLLGNPPKITHEPITRIIRH